MAWAVAMSYLFATVVAVGSILYANHVMQEAQQAWCGIVVTLDEAYRDQPMTTDAGRNIAAEIHKLRREFNCPIEGGE